VPLLLPSSLRLDRNRIGDDGASAIAESLKLYSSLRGLVLWSTYGEKTSTVAFAESFEFSSSFHERYSNICLEVRDLNNVLPEIDIFPEAKKTGILIIHCE
jgi:hypothetical protein